MYGVRAPAGTTSVGPGRGPLAFLRRTRASSFSPTDVAGLKLWLAGDGTLWQDSARTTPATADGDPVGAWDDASGGGNHATQATAGLRPLLKLSIVNGKPVVRFDGSDDGLEAPIAADASVSLFVVAVKRSAASALSRCAVSWGAGATIYTNSGDGSGWLWYPSQSFTVVTAFGGTVTDWVLLEMVFDSSDNVTPYRNAAAGTAFDPRDYDSQTVLKLGYGPSIGAPGDYDVAEALLYDAALSTADRQSVESYLNGRYAIY